MIHTFVLQLTAGTQRGAAYLIILLIWKLVNNSITSRCDQPKGHFGVNMKSFTQANASIYTHLYAIYLMWVEECVFGMPS